jgi:hypothetical protein
VCVWSVFSLPPFLAPWCNHCHLLRIHMTPTPPTNPHAHTLPPPPPPSSSPPPPPPLLPLSRCLTVGMPNYDPNVVHHGQDYTNNGTLHLEVWSGPLTPTAAGAARRVVALFNKGEVNETITAPSALVGTDTTAMAVRDAQAKMDLPLLARGQALGADVPSHGVRLFVLTAQS